MFYVLVVRGRHPPILAIWGFCHTSSSHPRQPKLLLLLLLAHPDLRPRVPPSPPNRFLSSFCFLADPRTPPSQPRGDYTESILLRRMWGWDRLSISGARWRVRVLAEGMLRASPISPLQIQFQFLGPSQIWTLRSCGFSFPPLERAD